MSRTLCGEIIIHINFRGNKRVHTLIPQGSHGIPSIVGQSYLKDHIFIGGS